MTHERTFDYRQLKLPSRRAETLTHANEKAALMDGTFIGRPKANNFEPYFTSLLHTLNRSWDTESYEKETAPIVASIDEYEGSNQIKGKIYAY